MLGQVVVSGLAMGAIYAVVALGYAFVWKTMSLVNFASGNFLTFPAFVFVATFALYLNLPFLLAAVCAAVVMACLGALFSRIVFARLQGQRAVVAILATVGFGLFLKEGARILYGPEPLLYLGPFGFDTVRLGTLAISKQQILVIIVVSVMMMAHLFCVTR